MCAFLILGSVSAFAQNITLRAGGGGQVLTRPDVLDNYLGSGTSLMLDVSLQPFSTSFPALEVVTTSTFDRFTLNESDLLIFYAPEVTRAVANIEDGDLSFFTGSAGLRYTIVDADIPSKPYFTAAGGFYHYQYRPATFLNASGNPVELQTTDGTAVRFEGNEVISTALGWNVGFGLDFKITDTYGFFVEAQYVVIYNENYGDAVTDLPSIRNVERTSYYPIRFGATIRLASFGASGSPSSGEE
jgi:hypothetical protein